MFDYKKLDEYKNYMLKEGVRMLSFVDGTQLLLDYRFRDFDLFKPKTANSKEINIHSHSTFIRFKDRVMKYFEEVK